MIKSRRLILWLRNDLRLHDNYVLNHAVSLAKTGGVEVLPVYCFDPRYYDLSQSKTKYGTNKTGLVRARF